MLIASIIGINGGGGIGYPLEQLIGVLKFRNASVAILACIITIGSVDLLAHAVWRKIQKI